jgi:aspartyl-tRNA(Asn)/glutamyl-tRNA(Gln) amidotransferase subunit A
VEEKPYYLSIAQLQTLLRARKTSSIEVVDSCLARIAGLNERLNAFITVLTERAREQAKEADSDIKAGKWRGPLHGIPVGIKDFYDTANVRTTAAFEHFKNRVPARDAPAVARLKDAGAILVGKLNMHTLGMGTTGLESYFGPVQNPWNAAYIPGGSSSGSAAAVAAGLCYATLDTDAIGSCRLPAACCGVVGFKGTYGLISASGVLEGEKVDDTILWLAHPGITTRSAEDTAIVLNAVCERHDDGTPPDWWRDVSQHTQLRVGTADNFTADEEVTRAFNAAVETLRTFGHRMVRASAPFDMPRFGDLHRIQTDRDTIADRTFKEIDLLLLPTTTSTVLPVADAAGKPQALSAANTMFANYFGLPAISVPCGFDQRGLPIGLQIIGKPWGDADVLRLAHEYETATAWRQRRPIA